MTDTAKPRTVRAATRPRRGAAPAAGMASLWLACMAAMAAGLLVDTWRTPAALLASECGAPGTLAQLAWRHAALMPASSAAMALAALLPWPGSQARLGERALCAVLMAIGMVLGARLGVQTALNVDASPFAGMVLGMVAGMTAALMPVGALSAWRR